MSDPDFEHDLRRLFAEAPVLADHDRFAARVQGRMNRGWALKNGVLTLLGGGLGTLLAAQFLYSRLSDEIFRLSSDGLNVVEQMRPTLVVPVFEGLSLGQWAPLWLSVGLGVSAVAFLIARLADEF